MKTLTGNKGAERTRRQLLRHVNSLKANRKWRNATATEVMDEISGWVRGMAKRAAQRKGGLGRK